jgi:hypothetical protein
MEQTGNQPDVEAGVPIVSGPGIVVRYHPLTVVVAPESDPEPTAAATAVMVRELLAEGNFEFAPVAAALQSLVVAEQPLGVAAVVDGEHPIVFLFDQAVAEGEAQRHQSEGRAGWTTAYATDDQLLLSVGHAVERPILQAWSRLTQGMVPGSGAEVRLGLVAPAITDPTAGGQQSAARTAAAAVAATGMAGAAAALASDAVAQDSADSDDDADPSEAAAADPVDAEDSLEGAGPADDLAARDALAEAADEADDDLAVADIEVLETDIGETDPNEATAASSIEESVTAVDRAALRRQIAAASTAATVGSAVAVDEAVDAADAAVETEHEALEMVEAEHEAVETVAQTEDGLIDLVETDTAAEAEAEAVVATDAEAIVDTDTDTDTNTDAEAIIEAGTDLFEVTEIDESFEAVGDGSGQAEADGADDFDATVTEVLNPTELGLALDGIPDAALDLTEESEPAAATDSSEAALTPDGSEDETLAVLDMTPDTPQIDLAPRTADQIEIEREAEVVAAPEAEVAEPEVVTPRSPMVIAGPPPIPPSPGAGAAAGAASAAKVITGPPPMPPGGALSDTAAPKIIAGPPPMPNSTVDVTDHNQATIVLTDPVAAAGPEPESEIDDESKRAVIAGPPPMPDGPPPPPRP